MHAVVDAVARAHSRRRRAAPVRDVGGDDPRLRPLAASETARQPLPVPTSRSCAAAAGRQPQRLLDDQLGFGTRDQGVAGVTAKSRPQNSRVPGDHRDRFAPRPAVRSSA